MPIAPEETPSGTVFFKADRGFDLIWDGEKMLEQWSKGPPIVSSTQWTPGEALAADWVPVYPEREV